jgi:molecular chaperone GrpE (heat shock protein)
MQNMESTLTMNGGPAAPVEEIPGDPIDFMMAVVSDNAQQMELMRGQMALLQNTLAQMQEQESSRERAFDTLYGELQDYKDDFVAQRMKPGLIPLLFLFDSIEGFELEIKERASNAAPAGELHLMKMMLQNLAFFRDQLLESLRIAEVTPLEKPQGTFNPKFQKVVEVRPVPVAQHGTILKVVRGGWLMKDQLLRPAEVVVGKGQ